MSWLDALHPMELDIWKEDPSDDEAIEQILALDPDCIEAYMACCNKTTPCTEEQQSKIVNGRHFWKQMLVTWGSSVIQKMAWNNRQVIEACRQRGWQVKNNVSAIRKE